MGGRRTARFSTIDQSPRRAGAHEVYIGAHDPCPHLHAVHTGGDFLWLGSPMTCSTHMKQCKHLRTPPSHSTHPPGLPALPCGANIPAGCGPDGTRRSVSPPPIAPLILLCRPFQDEVSCTDITWQGQDRVVGACRACHQCPTLPQSCRLRCGQYRWSRSPPACQLGGCSQTLLAVFHAQ